MEALLKHLARRVHSVKDIRETLYEYFERTPAGFATPRRKLVVLLVVLPCMGNGDVVFGIKIAQYLVQWYGAAIELRLATTVPHTFKKLGYDASEVIAVTHAGPAQCRRLKSLEFPPRAQAADVVFVAPLQSDFAVSFADVAAALPDAARTRTAFFSEYNDSLRKRHDFATGLGGARMGLLFTDHWLAPRRRLAAMAAADAYAVLYVAQAPGSTTPCVRAFVDMVVRRHGTRAARRHSSARRPAEFHVVLDGALLVPAMVKTLCATCAAAGFPTVKVVGRDGEDVLYGSDGDGGGGSSLPSRLIVLRGDVLPLSHADFGTLIRHSVKDVLITGDQSLTDVLSLCATAPKRIWYQVMSWKRGLAEQLADILHRPELRLARTACGVLQAVSVSSDAACALLDHWDFRQLARPKMDAVIAYARAVIGSPAMRELDAAANTARSLTSFRRTCDELAE